MYLSLIALPFIGAFLCAIRGRSLGFQGASIVTTVCVGLSAVFSWAAVYEVLLAKSPVAVVVMEWVPLAGDNLSVQWAFLFDDLSVVMAAVVLTVSALVHVYSVDYMSGDPHGQRFMGLLSLFTAFMVLLVTGDSLVILFTGLLAALEPPYPVLRPLKIRRTS